MQKIIIVEDDQQLRDLVVSYLTEQQFEVIGLADGNALDSVVQDENPDCIILDVNLPGADGFTLCRQLRMFYTGPILFLTARDDDIDQIIGFEIGGDDYATKPVEPRVLLARIRALLRRSTPAQVEQESTLLAFGGLTINTNTREVGLHQYDISLTTLEYDILVYLAQNSGKTISREQLYQNVIGREYDGLDRSADVRISRLRHKLKDNPKDPKRIKTIWGKGFYFVEDMWESHFDV